ncbi:MAG: hypothetical protein ACK5L2_04280, partial [Planctomyces sp.]
LSLNDYLGQEYAGVVAEFEKGVASSSFCFGGCAYWDIYGRADYAYHVYRKYYETYNDYRLKWTGKWHTITDTRDQYFFDWVTKEEDVFGTVPNYAVVTKTIPVTTQETQTLWKTENIIQQQKILVTERIEQSVTGLPSATFANESLRAGNSISIDVGQDASFIGLTRTSQADSEIRVRAGRDVILDGKSAPGAALNALAAVADLRAGLTVDVFGTRNFEMRSDAILKADDGDAATQNGVIRLEAGSTLTVQSDAFGGHEVYLWAGGDVLMQSQMTSGHLIDVRAGRGPAGIGSVVTNLQTDIDTLGSEINLVAGTNGGSLLLTDAAIYTAGPITLSAPAGSLIHSGGMIIADSLNASVRNNIEANLDVRTVTAASTGTGSISLQTNGTVTLAGVSTASGPISITGLDTITAQNVSAGGSSGDVNITGLIGDLVLGNISAGGDLALQSDVGEISRTPGTSIAADTVQWTGQLAAAFEIDSPDITLITRTPGDVVINYTGSETLILRQVYVLEGSLTVNTPGDLTVLDARLLSTSSGYNIAINAGGSVSIDHLSAGDYAATDSQAAQIRTARSLAADAPLTAIGSITVTAGGSIRQQGSGDSLVDVVADTLTLQAGTGISLLNLAANRIISATSAAGSITLTDSDGAGELTPGLIAGTLQAPAGVSLTTAGSLDVTRVSAAANGAAVVLSAGGSLTLAPAAGQSLMLTSGGAITISGTYITWSGPNTAGGLVTATAADSLVIPESTFTLSAAGTTLTAVNDLSLDGSIATSGTNKFTATSGSLAMAADIIARSGATISTLEFSAGK